MCERSSQQQRQQATIKCIKSGNEYYRHVCVCAERRNATNAYIVLHFKSGRIIKRQRIHSKLHWNEVFASFPCLPMNANERQIISQPNEMCELYKEMSVEKKNTLKRIFIVNDKYYDLYIEVMKVLLCFFLLLEWRNSNKTLKSTEKKVDMCVFFNMWNRTNTKECA